MLQELRFAVRSLAQSRGFTAAAVLTLAIGIAATTVVYGIVDALLLRPLPFGERSSRLVTLHSTHPTQAQDWDNSELSYPDVLDLREASRALAGVEGMVGRNVSLSSSSDAERVMAGSVTPGLFALLGVEPQIGRTFSDADGAPIGQESVALISDSLWHRLYGGDPSIVGRAVPINGRAVTIIGVMPPRFAFPEHQDVWLPYRVPRDEGRDRRSLFTVGLLREGATLAQVQAEASSVAAGLAARYPGTNRDWGIHVMPIREYFVGDATRRGLTAMLAAVALVLLVGCANVASLLVARGIGRQRELTVRTALGASRARVIRLLLMESLVLAAAASLLAALLAGWGLDALVASMSEPPPYWARIGIDARVLLFTALVGTAAALLSGLVPALRVSRVQAGTMLHGTRAGATRDQHRLQAVLVAGQVALSLTLLTGATLLARSTMALQHADVGFDPKTLLSFRVYLAGDVYDTPRARSLALERIVNRMAETPGVVAAAATGAIPSDDGGNAIRLVPERATGIPGEELGAQEVPATSGLFDALGLRLLEGRAFTVAETSDPGTDVAIVNARLAGSFWPGRSALGRQLRLLSSEGNITYRIVGVVPDIVYEELGEETPQSQLTVYVPYARAGWRTMAFLVRTTGNPASLAPTARRAVREADPAFAAFDLMTMADRRLFTSWGERFLGRTFGAFAVTGLLLACLGAYGLTAYSAAQRAREIGVRLAIGAQPRDIVRLLLGRGGRLALVGAVAGLPLAFAAARLLQGMLFRVSPWDPRVWAGVPVALVATMLLANFIPARRASQADPAASLRHE